jgi:phage terminase large subunit-like protein
MTAQTQTAKIARQYAEQVVAGEILACRWLQLACQRQLNDLARFKGKGSLFRFNPKLTDRDGRAFHPADNICAFIERLPHVKGPLAGKLINLEPWQVFILTTVFGWVKPDGRGAYPAGQTLPVVRGP